MNKEVYLGIDTSCYTTSVCFMDKSGEIVSEARRLLSVKEGSCGLQQSEMVFQHTRNLPILIEEAIKDKCFQILGIGVSAKPRNLEDSYMPAFLVGKGFAESLGAINKIPIWEISHQENHLEAGVWSAKGPIVTKFLMLHASGGTTDLLVATLDQASGRYDLVQVGGSIDLHAGQFIDRIGVALGLGFPAGPALEKLALENDLIEELPVSVRKGEVSLSGPATAALRKIEAGIDASALARGAERTLAETFMRMIRNVAQVEDIKDVLLVGGVASNSYIRKHVTEKLTKVRVQVWVPAAKFSSDNAVGCAAFATRKGEVNG